MSRIDSMTPVRMSTNMSVQRQTPNTEFGARVKNGLDTAASAAANGAAVAAPFVPGGAILSAAVSSVSTMTSGGSSGGAVGTAAYASGVGSVGGPINTTMGGSTGGSTAIGGASGSIGGGQSTGSIGQAANGAGIDLDVQYQRQMGLLALQNQMQQENQTFSTLSNVMKTKHDTAKNSIANVR